MEGIGGGGEDGSGSPLKNLNSLLHDSHLSWAKLFVESTISSTDISARDDAEALVRSIAASKADLSAFTGEAAP